MSLKIYFLRHGQTSHSRDDMFCGSGTDAVLTKAGEKMAEEFAKEYSKIAWKELYCSPQTRAQQTIRPLTTLTGQSVQTRQELCEIGYGDWEGLTVDEVRRKFSLEYSRWEENPATYSPPAGETANQIAARGSKVLEEIRQRHNSGNVLLVSHKATIRVVLCGLLGINLANFRYRLACPVCSVSIVEFGKRGPLLRGLADRSHLSEALRALPGT